MAPERRKQLLLAALIVILAVATYRAYLVWPSTTAAPPRGSSAGGGGRATGATPRVTAPDVHLDALSAERPRPAEGDRNLFRFKPKAPPSTPPPSSTPSSPAPAVEASRPPPGSGPPPPAGSAAIALKFIGVVEARRRGQTIAVLSDEHGVYHGGEGDTIEGRYRIMKIGAESIEVSYLDGRGRQTIRLSGTGP